MNITSKLPHVGTTIFTTMSALAQEHGAVNLSQGFPNFDPDARLRQLVFEHMERGANQYAPMPGLPLLRERIAEKIARTYADVSVHPDEITVTAGGTQALFCAIGAFVRPGDEVILLEPCYDSYAPSVEVMGGRVVPHRLQAPDYVIDWAAIAALVTPKTRMICINSPCNPTGTILTSQDLDQLAAIVEGTDIVILSDEVYEHLIYDGAAHATVLAHDVLRTRSLAVYSFGKTFHNTGWKMGYCVAPKHLTAEFRKVHQFNVFSANHPMQAAFADFLANPDTYAGLSAFYQQKRDKFAVAMADTPLRPLTCRGTYFALYSYAHLSDLNDRAYAAWLTRTHGVASIPVSAFYTDGTDQRVIRFCFAKTDDVLEEATKRLSSLTSE
jgi:methionine transaminase